MLSTNISKRYFRIKSKKNYRTQPFINFLDPKEKEFLDRKYVIFIFNYVLD